MPATMADRPYLASTSAITLLATRFAIGSTTQLKQGTNRIHVIATFT